MGALLVPVSGRGAPLDDIVVTATRYGSRLRDLPARVSVLTAEDLRRLPVERVDEALAYVAGVDESRRYGPASFASVASLRGLSSTQQGRTLVLLDGARLNTSATGGVDWNRIPLELVERVEVFKGPGSSAYGGDAVGGVVNIITRRPRRGVGGFAAGDAASYGTFNQRGMAAFRSSGTAAAFYARGYGFHGRGDGYDSTPEALKTNPYVDYGSRRYQEYGGAGLVGAEWGTGRAEFECAESDDFRGEGTRVRDPDGLRRRFGSSSCRLSGEGAFGPYDWRLLAYGRRERYRRLSETQTTATNYQAIETAVDRRDAEASASLSRRFDSGHRLTLGGELKAGRVDGADAYRTAPYSTLHDSGRRAAYAAYVQEDVVLGPGRPSVLLGLRFDRAHFYDGFYDNPSYPALSGPMPTRDWQALSWRLSARQRLREDLGAYASYSRGFRQPGLEDMVLTLVKGSGASLRFSEGNPDLGPERLDTYELGADYAPREGLRLSPSLYYSRGWDFIYNVNTGLTDPGTGAPIYRNENVAAVDIHGAEVEAGYDAGPAALRLAYSFTRSRISSCRQNPALNGNDLAYAPRTQAGAIVGWRFPWLEVSAAWRYKAGQFSDDANTQTVSPYSTLAFKARRRLGAGLAVSAALENALDRRYQESATELAPGRTVRATVSWEF